MQSPLAAAPAVDWLGTGLSGRPKFSATTQQQAESFFMHSLEAWRERMGLDKFILLGHRSAHALPAPWC